MSSKLIVLVEDNPDDEAMALFALNKNKLADHIIVLRDGQETLDYLFATGDYADRDLTVQPALILLDVKLPKLSGLEVLQRLRQDARTRFLPVVVLTTSDEEQDRLRSYEMCANSFIRKPVDFDEFVKIMGHIELYWLGMNEPPPLTQ